MKQSSGGALPASSDASRFGRGVVIVLLGMVAGRAFKLLTRVGIARWLGAEALGLYDLGWTIASMLAFFLPLGLHVAVVRFGTPLWDEDRAALKSVVERSVIATLGCSLLAGIVLYALSGVIGRRVFQQEQLIWILHILAFMLPFAAGTQVLAAATRATQNMRYTAYFRDLAGPGIQLACFVALFFAGYGLKGAVLAAVLGFAASFAGLLFVSWRLFSGYSSAFTQSPTIREMYRYSIPVAAAGMFGAYLLWVDRLIVGYLRSATELGLYAAAAQFAMLFPMLLSAFTTVFMPMFVDLWERREETRFLELLRVATRWGLYLSAPVGIVLLLVPSTALTAVFGDKFASAALPLAILILGQLVNVGSGPVAMVLMSTGRQKVWLYLTSAALTLNVVLNFVLLPVYGIVGAAWASALASTTLFGGGLLAIWRLDGLWPYDRRLWKMAPSLVVAAAGVAMVTRSPLPGPLAMLISCVVVSLSLMIGTLLVLGIEREDRELARDLWHRLRRRRRN